MDCSTSSSAFCPCASLCTLLLPGRTLPCSALEYLCSSAHVHSWSAFMVCPFCLLVQHQQNPPSGSPVDGVPSVPQQQYRAVPPGHAAGMPMGGGYQYRPMMMQHMGGMPHNLYAVGPRGELVALNHLPPGLMAQQHMMPRGGPPMQMAYGGYPQYPMAQQAMQHQPPMQHQSPMSQAAMSSTHVLAHNRAHAAAGQARQQQQQIMASHAASTLASLSPAHSESSSGQAMPASGHAAASVHPTWQRQPPPKQSAAPASYQREHQQSTVDAT